jgi:hypothetical protein
MLRCITKCATCVTLNRNTAPFVRLCPAHPHNPARAAVGGERTVEVSPARRELEVSRRLLRSSAANQAPVLPCVPNLPRSRSARGTLSRREQSNRHMANGKYLRRQIAQGRIAPCGRPCESMFRRARAAGASAPSNFTRAFGMQFATIIAERSFRYHSVCQGPTHERRPRESTMRADPPSTEYFRRETKIP